MQVCVGEGGCCCFIVCAVLSGEIWDECAGLWAQWMWKELPVSHFGRGVYSAHPADNCACLDCYPVLQPRLHACHSRAAHTTIVQYLPDWQ